MKQILDEHLLDQSPKFRKKRVWFYISLGILVIGSIISTIFSWYTIMSIIISGPAMSLIGILHLIEGKVAGERKSIFMGSIPLAISLIWLGLIHVFILGPGECSTIIPASLTCLSLLILIISIQVFIKKYLEVLRNNKS